MADTPKPSNAKSTEAKIAFLFLAFFLLIILTQYEPKPHPDPPSPNRHDLSWLSHDREVAEEIVGGLDNNQVGLLKNCVDRSLAQKKLFNENSIGEVAKFDTLVIKAYLKWVDWLRCYRPHYFIFEYLDCQGLYYLQFNFANIDSNPFPRMG